MIKKNLFNYSAYIWFLLFLLPTIYAIVFNQHINFRFINYLGDVWLIYVVYHVNFTVNNVKVMLPTLSIKLLFIALLITFLYSTYTQFYSFSIVGSDFSIFETMLQQALNGNYGYSTFAGYYHFSTHQNYILLIILPFYALVKSSLCLEMLAGIIVWLAGIMLWHLARRETGDHLFTLILIIAFYLCPGINNALQTNFRPELFFPLAFFLLFYCYKYSKIWLYLIALIFFLAIKEDASLYLLGFIYLAIKEKNYFKLWTTLSLSMLMIFLNLLIVQPYFTEKSHFILPITFSYWNQWGENKIAIIYSMLTHPLLVLKYIFDKQSGIWQVYLSTLFIPLLDSFTLLASLPAILLFATSNISGIHAFNTYYPILLTSLLLVGILRLKQRYRQNNLIDVGLTILLIIYPLFNGGWLELKPINHQAIKDLATLKQKILLDYPGYALCLYPSVYPYFSAYEFDIYNFNLKKSCIKVFTLHDLMVSHAQLSNLISKEKCKTIGSFIYCIVK